MDNVELLPCPYCGGEAQRFDGRGRSHDIACSNCAAQSALSTRATELWNTRAAMPDSGRIEKLEERIAAVRQVIEQGYSGVGKTDKCQHDKFGFEECIACYDEALLAALEPSR
jgi:capsule polysaccharide export protein KpsE/RkpR